MEPQIQYAHTTDGVSIAYITTGVGPPILDCGRHLAGMRALLSDTAPAPTGDTELAKRTRLTVFDHAGIGASQRDVSDFSLEAQVREIEAVAARLPDDPFTLVGSSTGAASAALYAARHPRRVRALVCVDPAATIAETIASEIRKDWSLARRLIAGGAYSEGPVSAQRWYSIAMRDDVTPEVAAAYFDEFARANLAEIYRRVPVPTLFCVAEAGPGRKDDLRLASVVPDCRVAFVPNVVAPAAAAILEFIGAEALHVDPSPARSRDGSSTAIILFTDIADSTPLTERMGDTAFRAASRRIDDDIRAAIRDAGGTPVSGKVLGDGVMGVFTSATQAIQAARRCVEASGDLPLHIGLHAGDVIREADNVYGGAVNIASRICGLCAPGEILVTATVRELARTSAGVTFEDRGEQSLKGIEDAVRVFAVRTEGP